jgi:multiple sugar transport system substrate-binding protein
MRPKWTKVSAVLACLFMLCGVMTACGNASGTPGKTVLRLAWWGSSGRATATTKAVQLFEKLHPDIQVQTSYSSYEAYEQKLATETAGGDAPDVMQLDYRNISQYAGSGMLLNLGTRPELRTNDIDPTMLSTGQVAGVQYAIPMARATETMVYDPKLWQKTGVPEPRPGWTWQDWADAMRKVSAATGMAGASDPGWSEDWFEVWLRGRGKQIYTGNGQLGFTADDLAQYWQWCTALRKQGAVSAAGQTTQIDGSADNMPLGRKQAVSDFSWDGAATAYPQAKGLRAAPMPVGPDGTPGQYFKPAMLIGASARTAHPAQAAELIDFLINDPRAGDILGTTRGIPVNRTVRARIAPKLTGFDKEMQNLQSSVEGKLKDPPQAPAKGDNTLQVTFQRDYDQVSFDRISPQDEAREYVTEANAELTR